MAEKNFFSRRVRQESVLVNNMSRIKKRAFQELSRSGISFEPANLRTVTDEKKIAKILQVANGYSKYSNYLKSSNLDSFGTLYDISEQTLNLISAPIHIPSSFSGIDWIEEGQLNVGFEKTISRNFKGEVYKGSWQTTTKVKGLSVGYMAGLELPGEYRDNIELHEVATLKSADKVEEEFGEKFISLYVIRDVKGNLRREISLQTISTGSGVTDHGFLYSENGKIHDKGKTGISYPPWTKESREKRDHDLELGLFQDYMAPEKIDFEKTWENIYRIVENNYPPNFEPSDLAGLIVAKDS